MKRQLIAFLAFILIVSASLACHSNDRIIVSRGSQQPQAQPQQQAAPQVAINPDNVGLDLQALGELAKKARDASHLEQLLNASGSINDLDLNGDGEVDYLSVTEYDAGNGSRGLSVTDTNDGNKEVASIVFHRDTSGYANVNLVGNPQYYGPDVYYQSRMSFTDALFLAWIFRPSPVYYVSPYHYGYYPPTYVHYRFIPVTQYRSTVVTRIVPRTSTITRTTTRTVQTTQPSPAQRVAAAQPKPSVPVPVQRQGLRDPNAISQKPLQARDTSKPVGSTAGFNNKPAQAPVRPATPVAAPRPAPQAPRPVPPPRSLGGKSTFGKR